MTRHFQVRVESETYQELEKRAENRGMSLNALGQEIVLCYLGKPPEPAAARIPRKHQLCLERTAAILASGDLGAIRALLANVDHFFDRLRPATDRKEKQPPT